MLVKGRSRSLALALVASAATLASGSVAAAAGPTKQECVAANENGQDLRHAGKLREAREQFAACTAATCPAVIREDCAQRLRQVEAALPSILFVARDRTGRDLSVVHVTMDGEPLLEKLDGTGVAIDPGEHRFAFKADGYRATTTTVVVREGDSDRPVRVLLESTAPPPAAPSAGEQASTHAPAPSDEASPRRPLAIGLVVAGGAGVVAGAIFGLVAKGTYDHARSECPTGFLADCPAESTQANQDLSNARSQALVSTVAFSAGGVLIATGAILFFTAPKATGSVTVGAAVTQGGGALALRGRW